MAFDYTKTTLLIEFNAAAGTTPTFESFKRDFALADDEADPDYGVLPLDESVEHDGSNALIKRTWMATVSAAAGERIEAGGYKKFIGLYSNHGRSNPPEY